MQLLWGRSSPQLPNPGAQSRTEQSSGAGACAVPGEQATRLSAAALWLLSGPIGFANLKQRGEMPQSHSPPRKAHAFQPEHWLSPLCLVGLAPAPLAQRPSLGNLQNSRATGEGQSCTELVPRVWPTRGLGRAHSSGLGGHEAEPTKHLLEPCCRALLG